VTGGLAVGKRDFSQFILVEPAPGFNNIRNALSVTKWGWTAGGGLEYALSRNWSVKAEYLYVDLGASCWPLAALRRSLTLPWRGRGRRRRP
jgi:outer membrane immunogenic protein